MSTIAITPTYSTARNSAFRQLGLWLQWNFRSMANMLPFLIVVQTGLSALMVFGYSLLLGDDLLALAPQMPLYITTGAVTMSMLMVGLAIVPQGVSEQKASGSFDWIRTLPTPRWVLLAAELITFSAIALPGAAVALLMGRWRFDIALSISPWVLVAAPLVTLIGTSIGYSMAVLLAPKVAAGVNQVVLFFVLLFSPLSFPAANFPGWLRELHRWLPFEPLADFMRATLVGGSPLSGGAGLYQADSGLGLTIRGGIVLAAWTIIAVAATLRVLAKRA
jgi:ABC-2 type transport system permease protein